MNYTYRNIWLINFPVMMSILIEQLINITDAIFLGHIGEIELGASALAGIWYLAIYMLGFGFSLGLQVVIARRNGERNYPETGKTFFQGLLFLSGLAILLCTVSKIFSPIVLGRLIASEEVYAAVIDYLDWRIWGLLFSFPFLALRSFLVGTTLTKPLNKAALAAVLVNIPCNWLLIFHFDMGIAGAAMASSFAELCSLAILSVHILREMNRQAYGLKWQFDRENIAACLPCLYLEHVQPVHRRSLMVCLFRGRRTSGRDGTGGYKCHTQHIHPVFVIVNSLAATTGSLVGNLLGAGQKDQVVPLCNRVIRMGYAMGGPLIILSIVCFNPIFSIYSGNGDPMQTAHLPFIVALLNYVFALPGYVYMNAVTGTGATRATFIFQAVTIIAYQIYLWSVSCVSTSLSVYWTAEYLYVILLGVLSVIYLKNKGY